MERSWQGAHLSTGASREAPVDNESFSTILKKSTPGISGSCFLTLGAMARSTLVNRCLARGTSGQCLFFNNPDDEQSWNSRLMQPYLWRHGEEHTCPQVPRARHLWTMSFSRILTKSTPGMSGLCIHTLGAIAGSTLVNRCFAGGSCGH